MKTLTFLLLLLPIFCFGQELSKEKPLRWGGFYAGTQVVNDFKSKQFSVGISGLALIQIMKRGSFQAQIIMPIGKEQPFLWRVAFDVKLF